jgi:pimeloyl-ACP methyl ester carboxylesterase
MSKLSRIAVLAAALVVLLLIAGGLSFWFRPLAVLVSLGRRGLVRAGLSKETLPSPAGVQTYFRGGSGPLLVLIHGAGDQAGTFAPVAKELMKGHTLVVPDLAGHGDSAPGSGPLTLGMALDGLDAILAKEAASGAVTIAGHSMGAWIATLEATRHPERVRHLVLIDGGPLRGDARGPSLLPGNREEARALMAFLRDPASPRVPDFMLDDVVRRARTGAIGRLLSNPEDLGKHLLDGKLGGVKCPADLIWGASDRLVPLEYARTLERALPAARLTTLPACGHVPQVECPTELLRALVKVLSEPTPPATISSPPGTPP